MGEGMGLKAIKALLFEFCSGKRGLNPLPDNKILDWSKLKQIADNIL